MSAEDDELCYLRYFHDEVVCILGLVKEDVSRDIQARFEVDTGILVPPLYKRGEGD